MATGTSKEVATTKQEKAIVPAHIASQFDDFDDDVVLTNQDYIIPRLKLLQGSSDEVKEGRGNVGEYMTNQGELLAAKDKDLELLIVKRDKYWSISEIDESGKKVKGGEWRREPFTLDNAQREWNFYDNGKKFSANIVYDNFVIVASADEKIFSQIPMIFSLSRSSARVAKDLNTKFQKLKTQGKLPVSVVYKFARKLEKSKDGDTFLVPTVMQGRDSTESEIEAAAYWRNELAKGKVKIDGEESGDEA